MVPAIRSGLELRRVRFRPVHPARRPRTRVASSGRQEDYGITVTDMLPLRLWSSGLLDAEEVPVEAEKSLIALFGLR
jgi:hypothetical protein